MTKSNRTSGNNGAQQIRVPADQPVCDPRMLPMVAHMARLEMFADVAGLADEMTTLVMRALVGGNPAFGAKA